MRLPDRTYVDVKVKTDGNSWVVVDGEGGMTDHKNAERMEQDVRDYRTRHGRRASDGGPLEWPPVERAFKVETL